MLRREWLDEIAAIALGTTITLIVCGYQFGGSNHTVYLVEALRLNDPSLLQNDWWATATLQYHGVFAHLSALLMRWGIIRPAFLVGYLALAVLMHVAWLGLVGAIGRSWRVYLASVVLFYLSAAGFGLGMYQFLQDSSFLPSNIANVAMLWGLYLWIIGRPMGAGICLGVAGLFHLNHALVGIGVWAALSARWAWDGSRRREIQRGQGARATLGWIVGTVGVTGLSLINIIPVARGVLGQQGHLPLQEFVELYVRLRHPHHYDPRTWGVWIWGAFLWPIGASWLALRWLPSPWARPVREAIGIFWVFTALLALALLGAGIFYISETLIQMSLYRFSIYPKLLSCIGAAALLRRIPIIPAAHLRRGLAAGFAVVLGAMVLKYRNGLIAHFLPEDDADYAALCDWVSDEAHTPRDAIFIVPPQEQLFRLRARRAIVVNFKGVPQLSSELGEWRRRMEAVLKMDITRLPHRFDAALVEMGRRYDVQEDGNLWAAASKYGARYVIRRQELVDHRFELVHASGAYKLYMLRALAGSASDVDHPR